MSLQPEQQLSSPTQQPPPQPPLPSPTTTTTDPQTEQIEQKEQQEEEEPICRVCRSEANHLQPLFHPCKCSGSIKYVHQDCLTEWLSHSKKKYCELCNHPFSFTPIYDPTMPASMPVLIFAKRVLRRCLMKIQFWLRVALVGSVWIVLLPFITVWIWRVYFWTGKILAYSLTGRLKENKPLAEETLQMADAWRSNETYTTNATSWTNITVLANHRQWTIYGVPVVNAASLFFSDCLEGQIITFGVVIGFVSAFLIREWIVRNTNQEALDDFMGEPNAQFPIFPPPPLPQPAEERRHVFDGIEVPTPVAPAELQPENQNPIAGSSKVAKVELGHESKNPEVSAERSSAGSRKGKERATDEDTVLPLIPSHSEQPVESRSANQRRFSASDVTQASTRTRHKTKALSISSTFRNRRSDIPWEDRVAELWSENTEYNSEYMSEEEDDHETGVDGIHVERSSTENQQEPYEESSSKEYRAADPSGTELPSIEQQTLEPFRNWWDVADGARSHGDARNGQEGEQRRLNRESSYDDRDDVYGTNNDIDDGAQVRRVPLIFGRGIARRNRPPQFAPSLSSATTENSPEKAITLINGERENRGLNLDGNSIERAAEENQARGPDEGEEDDQPAIPEEANQHVENVQVNVGDPPPPANPIPNPAMFAPIGEDDDLNGEDLDGFMEAIGMRGSLWTLLQNAVLMTLLIAVVIGGGIFVPYLIGKTALLFKPLDILYLPLYIIYLPLDILMFPLKILRILTDPVLDLFLDYCSPYVWPFVSTHFNLVSNLTSMVTETATTLSTGLPESITKVIEPLNSWMWEPTTAPIAPVAVSGDSLVNATLATASRFANATADSREGLQWRIAEFGLRWRDTGTAADKFACIALGYTIVLLLGAFYLSSTRNEHGRTVGTALAQGLSTMLTGFKVLLFVIIELAIFPTACGILLDFSMLPLFPAATVSTRWQFHLSAPLISTFLHWFVGTAFVYYFSVFVSVCREIVRPGVLWWLKDPTDPDFQPIKEILERPARTQLKKIAASAVIYAAIILLGLGSVVYMVKAVGRGILPLRRGDNEPVWDFPVDLVVANVLFPIFVRWANPKQIFRTLFTNWWRRMSRALRLTSFMFGDRYPEEEGSHVRRTTTAKLLFLNASVPTLEEIGAVRERRTREVNDIGGSAALTVDMAERESAANANVSSGTVDPEPAVYFVPDGGLVRAPAFDGIPVVPGKPMLIRVREDGITVYPSSVPESGANAAADNTDANKRGARENEDEPPGERAMEGQRIGVDESTNPSTTVVYVPPKFNHRVCVFLFLMWFHGSLLVCSLTILPLLVGRGFFARTFDRDVHDVYSLIVGAYFIVAFATVVETALRFAKKILHTEWWQAEWKQETKKVGQIILRVLANAYVIVSVAGLVALEVGIIHELYIFNPLRIATTSTAPLDAANPQFYLQSWGIGIFLLKIIYSGVFLARENHWSRTINEITAQGFTNLNVKVATRKLIVPVGLASVLAVMGPYALTWLLTKAIDVEDSTARDRLYHLSYPAVLCCVVAFLLQRQAMNRLEEWMQSVRDEEYLIGRQLNSLSPTGEPVPIPVPVPVGREDGAA